jgi:hypothetical protein
MRRFWIVVSATGLALLAGSGVTLADSCAAISSQMRVADSASNSKAVQIRRQIAAIRATERRRSCTAGKAAAGGLFNNCRGLARQREEAQRELANAKSSGRNNNHLSARYQALGCGSRSRPAPHGRSIKPEIARQGANRYAGNTLYYCVRPVDGYFFPAPNSQFGKRDYSELALEQCRFICEDPTMAVYVLRDAESETEEMVSVETDTPYRELPAAFRYQIEKSKTCNWSRYFALINALRVRTVTPRNMKNAIIPPPTFRPHQEEDLLVISTQSIQTHEERRRAVRMVGPRFLPDKTSNFRELSIQLGRKDSLAKTFETLVR